MARKSDAPSERTRLRRNYGRGAFDKETVYGLLDTLPFSPTCCPWHWTRPAPKRTSGPADDDEDYDLSIWAGVVPMTQQVSGVEHDARNFDGVAPSAHVTDFRFG